MVKLRLTRMGAKKKPFYRVVAADSRVQRDGRWIEQLGYYDPMKSPKVLKLDIERVDHWLSVGAQPTDTVGHLIAKFRDLKGEGDIVALPGKAPKAPPAPEPVVEAAPEAAVEAAPAAAAEAAPEAPAEAAPAVEEEA